ncbi:hypothetical protein C8R46DRAFT_1093854 [Mycena filopes]|nr:hypothetical protein C8R46DRAFT_1093854 [Mycena filopes]
MAESEPEVEPEPDVAVEELRRRRARGMYHNTQNEDEEAAMLETCSRLREVPCKWFACGLVLNSLESLVAHLHEIHAQEDETMTCMWDICGKTCISAGQLAIHAEGHALSSIPCAYQDCEGLFHTPRELVEHNREHTEASENADVNWELLPSFRPSAPVRVKEPEAASPPTWTIVTPPMYMPKISRERHMTLGPWVLRNITAPALNVRAKRYNAAKPMNSWLREDYEFVETSSVHFSSMPSRPARARDIADLDSVEVTGSVSEGKIVLWPPNGAGHLYDARPTTVDSAAKAESVSAGPVAGPPSTLVDGAQAEGVSAGPVAGPSFTLVDKAPSASGDLMVVDLSGDSVVVDPSDEMAVEKMLQDGHGQH